MFEENNSIIIVDDQPEHLTRLSNIFCQYGISCRTFHYNEMAEFTPLEGVKIAFFDVMLTNAGDENAQMAVLYDALKNYISPANHAFVLVLWTNQPEYKDKLIEYIKRPGNCEGIAKPIEIEVIDKNIFLENETNLRSRLESLMDETIVKCLFSFESELRQASDRSLSEILRLIPFPDQWGSNDTYINNVKNVFAKIAIETFGAKRGMAYPDLAIKELFGPLFLHYLSSNGSDVWKQFLGDIKKPKDFPDPSIVARLNTIFHLNSYITDSEARGIVRQIEYSNQDISQLFSNEVKFNPREWIDEVLLNRNQYEGEILDLIAVEISAACDYSNNKKRTHQYLLGAILPKSLYEMIRKANFSEAVFHLPFSFMYSGCECNLLLHFNFLLTEEENSSHKLLGPAIFELKNEVMNMICDRHARHISRIGITSFR